MSGGIIMNIRNNSGYTLVEIILAIAILGLVVVPILMFMSNSSGIITYADERERALLVAQEKMEDIKSMEYENIDISSNVNISSNEDIFIDRYPTFTRLINISSNDIDSDGEDDYKLIEIEITWGNNKSVQLKSKIAKR